jgi:hypothetical protein
MTHDDDNSTENSHMYWLRRSILGAFSVFDGPARNVSLK